MNYTLHTNESSAPAYDPRANLEQPKKEEIAFDFEKHLDGAVDKELLTQLISNEIGGGPVRREDLKRLVQTGAGKSGFYCLKEERNEVLVRLLEEDVELKAAEKKSETQLKIQQRLKKLFRKVFFWMTWLIHHRKRVIMKKKLSKEPVSAVSGFEVEIPKDPKWAGTRPNKTREWILNNPKIGLYFYCGLVFSASVWVFIFGFRLCTVGERMVAIHEVLKIGMNLAFGGKLAVLFVVDVMLVMMWRDVLTWLRKVSFIGKYFTVLLDEHVTIHKFCAYLLVLYSLIHSFGHLFGTFREIIKYPKEVLNLFLPGKFDNLENPIEYTDLLFKTIPGFTGVLLLIILFIIFISNFEFVKQREYQIFGYSHIFYILFCILLYVHGSLGLFNKHPYAVNYVTPFFVIALLHHLKKWVQCSFQSPILDVSFSAKNSVAYIKILKPKFFNVIPGQYLFLNVPSISFLQWHPFSLCSGGTNGIIKLMIKNSGDFTNTFLAMLFKAKSDYIVENNLDIGSKKKFQEIYYDFLLKETDESNQMSMKKNMKKLPNYPKIGLYGPISGRVVGAFNNRNVIFIGSGVGVSPYLIFLDEYVRFLRRESKLRPESRYFNEPKISCVQGDKMQIFFKEFEKVSFYYIARDCDQLSWIRYYVLKLIKYNYNPQKLDIRLFLTTSHPELKSLDNFLFWRALGKYQKNREKVKEKSSFDFLTDLPMPVVYRRPEFEKYFEETRNQQINPHDFNVYGCGTHPFLDSIQQACDKVNNGNSIKFVFFPENFW